MKNAIKRLKIVKLMNRLYILVEVWKAGEVLEMELQYLVILIQTKVHVLYQLDEECCCHYTEKW